MSPTTRTIFILGCCVLSTSCSAKKPPTWTYTAPPWAGPIPTSAPVGRFGIGCRTSDQPDTIGAPSYSVDDVGKVGVPVLRSDEKATIRSIRYYIKSKTLRFAFVDDVRLPKFHGKRFIVFDAIQGPCMGYVAGYWILNVPDEYYSPGNGSKIGEAYPDVPTPGPWMHQGDSFAMLILARSDEERRGEQERYFGK